MHTEESYFSKFRANVRPFDVRSCELPIQYRAGVFCGLLYRIDLARARFYCDALCVEPRPFFGAALAGIYAWDHVDTSLGPFSEIGIGLLTRRRRPRLSLSRLTSGEASAHADGMLVLSSAVTSHAAQRAGQELWGYPRYLTCTRTQIERGSMRMRLGTELELDLGPVRGLPRRSPFITFSVLHGQLLRTALELRCAPVLGQPSRAALHLLGGDGPSSEHVQALGLHRLRPVLAFQSERFCAALPTGRVLGLAAR